MTAQQGSLHGNRPHDRQIVNIPTVENDDVGLFRPRTGDKTGEKGQVFRTTCR
jgi:hypothetical protein